MSSVEDAICAGDGKRLISFSLGGQEYGIDIDRIQEIEAESQPARLPESPPFIEGVIPWRGGVIPLIDLGRRLGSPRDPGQSSKTIVVLVDGQPVGLMVDDVSDVLLIAGEDLEPPPLSQAAPGSQMVEGVGRMDGRLLIVIDPEHVLSPEERADLPK